jgi:hypothetical protein
VAAATHGVEYGRAFVELTTAHLFDCMSPAVVAERNDALQRARRIHRSFHIQDAANEQAKRIQGQQSNERNDDNDSYTGWWQRLTSNGNAGGAITPATIAIAIGAFTANSARKAMSTAHWRVDKERRGDAVLAMRRMAAAVVQHVGSDGCDAAAKTCGDVDGSGRCGCP